MQLIYQENNSIHIMSISMSCVFFYFSEFILPSQEMFLRRGFPELEILPLVKACMWLSLDSHRSMKENNYRGPRKLRTLQVITVRRCLWTVMVMYDPLLMVPQGVTLSVFLTCAEPLTIHSTSYPAPYCKFSVLQAGIKDRDPHPGMGKDNNRHLFAVRRLLVPHRQGLTPSSLGANFRQTALIKLRVDVAFQSLFDSSSLDP